MAEMAADPSDSLWYRALWEEEQRAGGEDFYRWGFEETRFELEKMLEYAHRLGVTAKGIRRRRCSGPRRLRRRTNPEKWKLVFEDHARSKT